VTPTDLIALDEDHFLLKPQISEKTEYRKLFSRTWTTRMALIIVSHVFLDSVKLHTCSFLPANDPPPVKRPAMLCDNG